MTDGRMLANDSDFHVGIDITDVVELTAMYGKERVA